MSAVATRILTQFAATDYNFGVPRGAVAVAGSVKVWGIVENNVITYSGNGGTHRDVIPAGANPLYPGQGNGDRCVAVFGRISGIATFSIAGDGVSVDVPVNDGSYIGNSEIRWSTCSGNIAVASNATVGSGANLPFNGFTANGSIYLHALDGTYVGKAAHNNPVSSLSLTAANIYAMTGNTVYQYSAVTFNQTANFALPSGTAHRVFTTQQGGLAAANAEQEVYTWNGSAWSLFMTLAATDGTNLGTTSFIHAVDGPYCYAVRCRTDTYPSSVPNVMWRSVDLDINTRGNYYPSLTAAVHSIAGAWWGPTAGCFEEFLSIGIGQVRPRRGASYTMTSENDDLINYSVDGAFGSATVNWFDVTPAATGSFTISIEQGSAWGDSGYPNPPEWFTYTHTYQFYRAQIDSTVYQKQAFSHDVYKANWTQADQDAVASTAAQIQRKTIRWVQGVEVDTLECVMHLNSSVKILGIPAAQFIAQGGLDGARVSLDRYFSAGWADEACGSMNLFNGQVADIAITGTEAQISVKSDLELLTVQMPRNMFQAPCLHSLYDPGCGLSAAALTVTGNVTANSSVYAVNCNLSQASGYFSLGVITFTTGINVGVQRTVKQYTTGVLVPTLPLPYVPAAGDHFTARPGCDKLLATCNVKFSNSANFRGFPFIPVPESAM